MHIEIRFVEQSIATLTTRCEGVDEEETEQPNGLGRPGETRIFDMRMSSRSGTANFRIQNFFFSTSCRSVAGCAELWNGKCAVMARQHRFLRLIQNSYLSRCIPGQEER